MIGIVGPTASGKSFVGAQLAKNGYAILNADSQQVFKEFPTLKAIDFLPNHFLYAFVDHYSDFNVGNWLQMVESTLSNLNQFKVCIIGGTGLYFNALQNGINSISFVQEPVEFSYALNYLTNHYPEIFEVYKDQRRLLKAYYVLSQTGQKVLEIYQQKKTSNHDIVLYSLIPTREQIVANIRKRLSENFEQMVFEVSSNLTYEKLDVIGYDLIKKYLNNSITKQQCFEQIFIKTRQYAKRQVTYIKNVLKIEKKFENAHDLLNFLIK